MLIRSTKPENKTVRLPDGEGLVLLIAPNGAKGWRFRYRFNGKSKMISLGVYPSISLKEARLKKAKAQELLSQDIDPSQARQAEKLSKAVTNEHSFEAVARKWWASWKSARVKRYADSV